MNSYLKLNVWCIDLYKWKCQFTQKVFKKQIMSLLKITNLWFCSNLRSTKCCFASADVTVPFMKCDEGKWSNDIAVNTHCDVTVGRWCCLVNHISQQWVGDVAAAQGGTSVQLYYKALRVVKIPIQFCVLCGRGTFFTKPLRGACIFQSKQWRPPFWQPKIKISFHPRQ